MTRLNYAILGCGAAGKVHGYHFSRDPRVRCVAAMDPDPDARLFFQEHFQFERTYSNCQDLFDNEALDIVSIASPPASHLAQLHAAANAHASILCEKPIVVDRQEACQLQKMLETSRGILTVMLPRRFYNNTLRTKEVLNLGALGEIQDVDFQLECNKEPAYFETWRGRKAIAGGGVLMSQAIHSIDQLLYLFGQPEKVSARVRRTRPYIEVEDEAEGVITFQTGVKARFRATANSSKTLWQGLTLIRGTDGLIELDSAETRTWNVPVGEPPVREQIEDVPEVYKPVYYGPGHRKVINAFLDAVEGGTAPPGGDQLALTALLTIFGMYESSNRGHEIRIEPPCQGAS